MNHVLLGASLPFLVAVAVYARRRFRMGLPGLIVTPLAMAAFGLWADAPDLPRIVGLHGLYLKLSLDPRMNVFFWHYAIDQIETDSPWYTAGIALMAAALLAAALRELRLRDRTEGGR